MKLMLTSNTLRLPRVSRCVESNASFATLTFSRALGTLTINTSILPRLGPSVKSNAFLAIPVISGTLGTLIFHSFHLFAPFTLTIITFSAMPVAARNSSVVTVPWSRNTQFFVCLRAHFFDFVS